MKSVALLAHMLSYTHGFLHHIADDLTEQEWTSRLSPGQNMVGYTVWHLPRTQDNIIQTWIRGLPELAANDRWSHWQSLKRLNTGVGIALEEADEIAYTARRDDVLAYADAVQQEALTWLGDLTDDDLETIPDARAHLLPYPEYQTPGFHAETDSLLDKPIWGLLMRPCIGHVHRHLGELMVIKDVLRGG